jgi:hypothetical protein
MKYKIVAYTIRFTNGRERKGIVPYLGEGMEPEVIKAFISDKIFELDDSIDELSIDVVHRYLSEHEWIISVHQLDMFRLLYWREGFGKELLEKYELPAPLPLSGHEKRQESN